MTLQSGLESTVGSEERRAASVPTGTTGSGAPPDPSRFLEAWCDRWWNDSLAPGGVRMELVDGPAWRVWIDLDGTPLEGWANPPSDHGDGASAWWHWWSDGHTFHLVAAVRHLVDGLAEFCRIARSVD